MWNADKVEVTPMAKTEQEIHITVKVRASNFSWLFPAIYASPRFAERSILWNNLMQTAELHSMPWVIAGDFNEPLNSSDKLGGREVSISRSLLLKECLDKCNMVDLGFSGSRFTWTNRRDAHILIQERIDRFFVNTDWCTLYLEAHVTHLTRCHLDHNPILLETNPTSWARQNRLFKFQSFWLSDPSFPQVVQNAWTRAACLKEAISEFSRDASDWNREHFGNIFEKKNRLMARLRGIQKALAVCPSVSLVDLERKLQADLCGVLNQEEELWALKSRVNWMLLGDRNTSFYHISTLVRRKRNSITAIMSNSGEWLHGEREVKEVIWNGFLELFTTSHSSSTLNSLASSSWQAQLMNEEHDSIGREVSIDEIKAGLWSLKAFKAPGPDGLHAGFFPAILAYCRQLSGGRS